MPHKTWRVFMIKIIIFSDIRIYCEGLSQVLSRLAAFEVVGAENSLEDAVSKVRQRRPHVMLLDMTMTGSGSMARQFMHLFPQIKIVALAAPEDEQTIIQCAEVGVSGYMAREASLDELAGTLEDVTKGEFCCPSKIAACIFRKVKNTALSAENNYPSKFNNKDEYLFDGLTKRERQIVTLMADGLSNKQISHCLTIEVSTVKNHVHNILVKLDAKSRTQAVSLLQRASYYRMIRSLDLDPGLEISH
jgi:DNA-binding NarL/FixJ family response regulator